jgi:DNA invertase Pin-like site-specific DNA recombinase
VIGRLGHVLKRVGKLCLQTDDASVGCGTIAAVTRTQRSREATSGSTRRARDRTRSDDTTISDDEQPQRAGEGGGEGQLIGYARVSTRGQDLALQLVELKASGCVRIFQDVGSGTIRRRPQLDACLDYLRPGDTLVVWRLDRLGRSLRHLIEVIAGLESAGVAFRSLRESIDTTTAAGRLHLHMFGALAEFERELIRERSQAGREVAKAAGRLGGRPRKMTDEKRETAQALRERGDMTMSQIARALEVGRTTLYSYLDVAEPDEA